MIYDFQNYLQLSKSFSIENCLLILYDQNIDYKKKQCFIRVLIMDT